MPSHPLQNPSKSKWLTPLSLVLSASIWLPSLHLFFRPAESAPLQSPHASSLLSRQLWLWENPAEHQKSLARMRQSNAEWDFMGRTFLVLALSNQALAQPLQCDRYLNIIDQIIEQSLQLERDNGLYYFLMPYAKARPFIEQPARSAFVDGEIALMLAARATLKRHPAYEAELQARLLELRRRMEKSPVLSAESYPDECWTFCNSLSLAAMRMADSLFGSEEGKAFGKRWISMAKDKLLDKKTGLLISEYTLDGGHLDGPEGSSIWIVAHALMLIDPEFARGQYDRAKKELGAEFLGFGWAREWPASRRGPADIDSGPIVPFVEASAGSSGLFLVGAGAFGDGESLNRLITTLDFAAFPMKESHGLRYAAGNQVGDAALLYALSIGPLWQRVLQGGQP